MSSGRSDIIDISAELRGESEKAYLIFDGAKQEWVPKSQAERDIEGKTFAMPEWLAKEKGFI